MDRHLDTKELGNFPEETGEKPDLWKRLLKAIEPHEVHFNWVKGHNGHPINERCDKLATTAADGTDLLDDDGLNGV